MTASDPRIDVTIVVPVFNHWDLTEACLKSLRTSAASSNVSAEILISDDASTDETERAWSALSESHWPVRYRRNDSQLGFLRNCNAAAAEARGRYLCLLNNDIVVQAGWLDTLVETIESAPDIGAVGPMFLAADGSILESGAIVHVDGSARQLGHGRAPSDPRYAYVNDVDYVSGACLLLATELFRELGGFDEQYVPAYYEDTDLCLKLADRGLRVVVNPAAKMTHFEGGSHGSSATSGLKRYQEINRDKFARRWADRLAAHHPQPFEAEDRARTWRRKDAYAFYYPRPLTYNMDSGALRLYRLMLELRGLGHHVLLVNPEDEGPRRSELNRAGVETMRVTWGGEEHHMNRLRFAPPAVAVFSHLITEERFAKSYYELSRPTVRIFDTVDLQFVREARGAAVALGVTQDPVLTATSLSWDALAELAAMRRSDLTLVVSDAEQQLLTQSFFLEPSRVRVVSNIHEPSSSLRAYDDREGFVFLAGFAHPPNIDAAIWTATKVWPLIRKSSPDARLDIYGSSVPREVAALNNPKGGIYVRGYVADHRAALGGARVMLAPLRYGAGVKGKLGEALAVGTPVVTTVVGAEGMDAEGAAMVVAEKPERLARLAVALYGDREDWERRSTAGLDVLRARFSARANVDALLSAVEDAKTERLQPNPYDFTARLMWYELGNPGEPQTIEMNWRNVVSRNELPSLPRRVWRYYRTHGVRAVFSRIRDELRMRRQLAATRRGN
jgi:O-antigen biosynthesis protein